MDIKVVLYNYHEKLRNHFIDDFQLRRENQYGKYFVIHLHLPLSL